MRPRSIALIVFLLAYEALLISLGDLFLLPVPLIWLFSYFVVPTETWRRRRLWSNEQLAPWWERHRLWSWPAPDPSKTLLQRMRHRP